jgi:hypothetical protein
VITPTEIPLTIYRDSAFDAQFNFANADGSAYDFTGWTIGADMSSPDPANADQFTVEVTGGSVILSLTYEQTAALNVNSRTNYTINGTGPGGSGPYFLVNGQVSVVDVT